MCTFGGSIDNVLIQSNEDITLDSTAGNVTIHAGGLPVDDVDGFPNGLLSLSGAGVTLNTDVGTGGPVIIDTGDFGPVFINSSDFNLDSGQVNIASSSSRGSGPVNLGTQGPVNIFGGDGVTINGDNGPVKNGVSVNGVTFPPNPMP